ncbi:type III polyketide synthase [Rossellomorea sp. YZS02]|uniref:type III polyketide synthase n=1 Tax=Rossellomorea sp. YZS02 TaxID=3097358 RepID=UPI002A164A92|nr:3-oxoacyl-[acyl-carrier-protein] synthase III C-terminal domain-containing protein [Rossellomorea sp. YZS02]MDX8343860.1 3-oxoacyl-[acyl-carrier-protein] synthase III C-terminal domain-containing protein [Rossellomorea sp. YZS02]
MPKILSVETEIPPVKITQNEAAEFAKQLFSSSFRDIGRLINVFQNGEIENRYFVKDLEWFSREHSLQEKNDEFIHHSVELGTKAVHKVLSSQNLTLKDIDAILTISTSGLSTPSLEARIMNRLPFSPHVKRIPIWGLGCAGGASGLSRAYEYCLAFPESNVLVLSIELCSLTFQHGDRSKSNLIGTSLFADGVACALVCGDKSLAIKGLSQPLPTILATQSTLLEDSLDVMGWEVKENGLHVVFSKDIPTLVKNWLRPNVEGFIGANGVELGNIKHFVAHPGGKKVIEAYREALGMDESMTNESMKVLKEYGNMSSVTILYVLKEFMDKGCERGDIGLGTALGPGFSSELLLMRWE